MIAPNSAAAEYMATIGGIPKLALPDGTTVSRPCRSWLLHQLRWRFLLDSWEGGEAYRLAAYGIDVKGLPVRNLIRHKREYPAEGDDAWSLYSGRPAGTDQANQATDDDYELRRARTPVPTFLADAVKRHLGKIYGREITRDGPPELVAWWNDVDGDGSVIDHWMKLTAAPLLMVLGQLDILIEPPVAPPNEPVESRADYLRLGLDRVIASYILPENLPWWRLNTDRSYRQVVVREVDDEGAVRYRYWDDVCWQLYKADGRPDGYAVLHHYGRVPIVRVFDRRRPRETHVGLPRYEPLAEIQREYYNRDSELVLSDTTHAHPLLQGPEDYIQADGTVPIGPNWLLPKKKNANGTATSYEGFEVVEFPHQGAESIRNNKHDLQDAADRASMLMKPAGVSGTSRGTVGQSGVSKRMDLDQGADLLGEISETLHFAEQKIAELALAVMGRPIARDLLAARVPIAYPRNFNLKDAEEMLRAILEYEAALLGAGNTPEIDAGLLGQAVRAMLPGLEDEEYREFDAEIDAYLARQAEELSQKREANAQAVAELGALVPGESMRQAAAGTGDGTGGEATGQQPGPPGSQTETNDREAVGNSVGARTQ